MIHPAQTVLVVDGDLERIEATCRLLRANGFVTFEARAGSEALQIAKEQRPHLILLDGVLADVDGSALCAQLKEELSLSSTLVVMLWSKRIESDDQAEGLEGGADGYITRPISNPELLARVRSYARLQRAQALSSQRARQHAAVAEAARLALAGMAFDTLVVRITRILAETLDVPLARVLESVGPQCFRVRGLQGEAIRDEEFLDAEQSSIPSLMLQNAAPIVIEDTSQRRRGVLSPALEKAGAKSGVVVAIPASNEPFGVLSAFALSSSAFLEEDVGFIQSLANILGLAIDRDRMERQRERLVVELETAAAKVKTLREMLPMCAWCGKVRNDHGYWRTVQAYLHEQAGTEVTHGICPECAESRFSGT
ncbi:MAG: response regulator [Deltaproteobacteria bacterium]|nr:response regulator [Deltaproteobacteria bacterium]